ncbi:unnamed protein product, partial [Closterium sp. Naga37s-1]
GWLYTMCRTLSFSCPPTAIPPFVEIDLTTLDVPGGCSVCDRSPSFPLLPLPFPIPPARLLALHHASHSSLLLCFPSLSSFSFHLLYILHFPPSLLPQPGGWLYTMRRTLPFSCPPSAIPPFVEVDLSALDVGHKITLADVARQVDPRLRLLLADVSHPVCKIAGSRSLAKEATPA